jgi:hypothetical protein
MRLESLSSRMDFDERRARALETVVQYRPGTGPAREAPAPRPRQDDRPYQPPPPQSIATTPSPAAPPSPPGAGETNSTEPQAGESNTARRRRRRRRGRRGGRGRMQGENVATGGSSADAPSLMGSATPPHGDPTGTAALDEGPDADFDGPEAGDFGTESGDDEGPDSAQ